MRNVEKIAERALKGVEKIARAEVKRTAISSVSACSAIWHQPKRPKKSKSNKRICAVMICIHLLYKRFIGGLLY